MLNSDDIESGELIHLYWLYPKMGDENIPREDLITYLDQTNIQYVIPTSQKYPYSVLIEAKDLNTLNKHVSKATDNRLVICPTKWK